MPTYEYRCQACGHEFEEFQSITADPLTKCPACHKKKLIFKGSGFYQTDYRSESYKKAAEADKPATVTTSGSKAGESKSDATKPTETKAATPAATSDKKPKKAGSAAKRKAS